MLNFNNHKRMLKLNRGADLLSVNIQKSERKHSGISVDKFSSIIQNTWSEYKDIGNVGGKVGPSYKYKSGDSEGT